MISYEGGTLAEEFLAITQRPKGDAMSDLALEFLWKAISSGGNGCPALIKTNGGYYVQGVKVTDPAKRAAIQEIAEANGAGLRPEEDVLFVPADVLDRLHD